MSAKTFFSASSKKPEKKDAADELSPHLPKKPEIVVQQETCIQSEMHSEQNSVGRIDIDEEITNTTSHKRRHSVSNFSGAQITTGIDGLSSSKPVVSNRHSPSSQSYRANASINGSVEQAGVNSNLLLSASLQLGIKEVPSQISSANNNSNISPTKSSHLSNGKNLLTSDNTNMFTRAVKIEDRRQRPARLSSSSIGSKIHKLRSRESNLHHSTPSIPISSSQLSSDNSDEMDNSLVDLAQSPSTPLASSYSNGVGKPASHSQTQPLYVHSSKTSNATKYRAYSYSSEEHRASPLGTPATKRVSAPNSPLDCSDHAFLSVPAVNISISFYSTGDTTLEEPQKRKRRFSTGNLDVSACKDDDMEAIVDGQDSKSARTPLEGNAPIPTKGQTISMHTTHSSGSPFFPFSTSIASNNSGMETDSDTSSIFHSPRMSASSSHGSFRDVYQSPLSEDPMMRTGFESVEISGHSEILDPTERFKRRDTSASSSGSSYSGSPQQRSKAGNKRLNVHSNSSRPSLDASMPKRKKSPEEFLPARLTSSSTGIPLSLSRGLRNSPTSRINLNNNSSTNPMISSPRFSDPTFLESPPPRGEKRQFQPLVARRRTPISDASDRSEHEDYAADSDSDLPDQTNAIAEVPFVFPPFPAPSHRSSSGHHSPSKRQILPTSVTYSIPDIVHQTSKPRFGYSTDPTSCRESPILNDTSSLPLHNAGLRIQDTDAEGALLSKDEFEGFNPGRYTKNPTNSTSSDETEDKYFSEPQLNTTFKDLVGYQSTDMEAEDIIASKNDPMLDLNETPIQYSSLHGRQNNPLLKLTVGLVHSYQRIQRGMKRRADLVEELARRKAAAAPYYYPKKDELLNNGKYKVVGYLGRGSFGVVVKAQVTAITPSDSSSDKNEELYHQFVAIKISRRGPSFLQQGDREQATLEHIHRNQSAQAGEQDQFVQILDSFFHGEHLCIVFELLADSLFDLVKYSWEVRPDRPGLSLRMLRKLTHQLLCALMVLKNLKIIHCDLKPENIALSLPNRPRLKILDFGSACFVHDAHLAQMPYIQSRYYRAPEVLLGTSYTCAIDMWSLGCILAELYLGRPMFEGNSSVEQFACIVNVIGMPPYNILKSAIHLSRYFRHQGVDAAGKIAMEPVFKVDPSLSQTIKEKIMSKKEENSPIHIKYFTDLLTRMLEWDPACRLTPTEAINHNFILYGPKGGDGDK